MASEFGEGLSAGFALFAVELMVVALFLVGEATTSASAMILLTILVSLVSFAQSMAVGSGQSGKFLVGFFFRWSFGVICCLATFRSYEGTGIMWNRSRDHRHNHGVIF